ncbi:hypothetical protein D3C76_1506590 [compost metagenome]
MDSFWLMEFRSRNPRDSTIHEICIWPHILASQLMDSRVLYKKWGLIWACSALNWVSLMVSCLA